MKNLILITLLLASASAFADSTVYKVKGKCYVIQANTKSFYADIISRPTGISYNDCDEAYANLEKQCNDAAKMRGANDVSVYKDIQIIQKSVGNSQESSHSSYGGGSFVLLGGFGGSSNSSGSSNAETTEVRYIDIDPTEGKDCKVKTHKSGDQPATIQGTDIGS